MHKNSCFSLVFFPIILKSRYLVFKYQLNIIVYNKPPAKLKIKAFFYYKKVCRNRHKKNQYTFIPLYSESKIIQIQNEK